MAGQVRSCALQVAHFGTPAQTQWTTPASSTTPELMWRGDCPEVDGANAHSIGRQLAAGIDRKPLQSQFVGGNQMLSPAK